MIDVSEILYLSYFLHEIWVSIILIHQIITILAKRMRVMIVIFYSKNNQLITKQ